MLIKILLEKYIIQTNKNHDASKIHDTELKIRIAVKEIEMINTLISANVKKYLLMLNNSDKMMSYYEIDQFQYR